MGEQKLSHSFPYNYYQFHTLYTVWVKFETNSPFVLRFSENFCGGKEKSSIFLCLHERDCGLKEKKFFFLFQSTKNFTEPVLIIRHCGRRCREIGFVKIFYLFKKRGFFFTNCVFIVESIIIQIIYEHSTHCTFPYRRTLFTFCLQRSICCRSRFGGRRPDQYTI